MQIKHEYTNTENKLIYPELSYKIIGAAFNVYNELGWGQKEVIYQKALVKELTKQDLKFEREKYVNIKYQNEKIGGEFLDFVI